jgi:hypothetical protein
MQRVATEIDREDMDAPGQENRTGEFLRVECQFWPQVARTLQSRIDRKEGEVKLFPTSSDSAATKKPSQRTTTQNPL